MWLTAFANDHSAQPVGEAQLALRRSPLRRGSCGAGAAGWTQGAPQDEEQGPCQREDIASPWQQGQETRPETRPDGRALFSIYRQASALQIAARRSRKRPWKSSQLGGLDEGAGCCRPSSITHDRPTKARKIAGARLDPSIQTKNCSAVAVGAKNDLTANRQCGWQRGSCPGPC